MNTFPKEEHLCGKTAMARLLKNGRWGTVGHIKYCWLPLEEAEHGHLVVSVPKKFYKRAVKRNLLKRRMREAYRLQKQDIRCVDLLLSYSSAEIADFSTIYKEVGEILAKL